MAAIVYLAPGVLVESAELLAVRDAVCVTRLLDGPDTTVANCLEDCGYRVFHAEVTADGAMPLAGLLFHGAFVVTDIMEQAQ